MSDYNAFRAHFPTTISKSLARYVSETVLKESRYLFYRTVLGEQFAYCTHCNKKHRSQIKLKHKQEEKVKCPHCKSMCQVRATGVSRKYHSDSAIVVWYEKSVIDSNAIVARVFHVNRNYSEHYEYVETKFSAVSEYLFMKGHSEHWHFGKKQKTVFTILGTSYLGLKRFVALSNIKRAVKGTPFQYSTWQTYAWYKNPYYTNDVVEFFDLAARYPCIEYLTKAGFSSLVEDKLHGANTYRAVHWNGKTLMSVLRLTKHELKEIQRMKLEFNAYQLRFYQISKQKGYGYNLSEAHQLAESMMLCNRTVQEIQTRANITEKDVGDYILKQAKNYSRVTSCLFDWNDYLKECVQLGMILSEHRYLYPNNLKQAHEATTKKIKLKKDKQLNSKIKKRYLQLKPLTFQKGRFIAIPAQSSRELFNEGKVLNHCVGGYVENYASGNTNLFLVRAVDDQKTPFYTLEIKDSSLRQCRGKNNCDMTDEVEAFIKAFDSHLKTISKKMKEVAV